MKKTMMYMCFVMALQLSLMCIFNTTVMAADIEDAVSVELNVGAREFPESGIEEDAVSVELNAEEAESSEENIEEIMPAAANSCIPASAYAMYDYITAGHDPSIYTYHEYENDTAPFLPGGTTYTTYYMTGAARLVIGADGSAYYSPNHYQSWYKL